LERELTENGQKGTGRPWGGESGHFRLETHKGGNVFKSNQKRVPHLGKTKRRNQLKVMGRWILTLERSGQGLGIVTRELRYRRKESPDFRKCHGNATQEIPDGQKNQKAPRLSEVELQESVKKRTSTLLGRGCHTETLQTKIPNHNGGTGDKGYFVSRAQKQRPREKGPPFLQVVERKRRRGVKN